MMEGAGGASGSGRGDEDDDENLNGFHVRNNSCNTHFHPSLWAFLSNVGVAWSVLGVSPTAKATHLLDTG